MLRATVDTTPIRMYEIAQKGSRLNSPDETAADPYPCELQATAMERAMPSSTLNAESSSGEKLAPKRPVMTAAVVAIGTSPPKILVIGTVNGGDKLRPTNELVKLSASPSWRPTNIVMKIEKSPVSGITAPNSGAWHLTSCHMKRHSSLAIFSITSNIQERA
jgi:hypothetical protein